MIISVFQLYVVVVIIIYGIKRTLKLENAVMQNFVHNYKFMINYNKQMVFNTVLLNVFQKYGNTNLFIFLKKKYVYQAVVIMILLKHLLLIVNNVFQHQKKIVNHIIT